VTLDICAALGTFVAINGYDLEAWKQFGDASELTNFTGNMVDVVVLLVCRLIGVATFALLAVHYGSTPALQDADVLFSASSMPEKIKQFEAKKRAREAIRERKHALLAVPFVICTFSQMLTGVKVVSFDFELSQWNPVLTAALVCITLASINIEAFLVRSLVQHWTKEKGKFRANLHPHVLQFKPNLVRHKCNLCLEDVTSAYNCKKCDYDVCVPCFNRKADHGEGLIRTDRGVKRPIELTVRLYLQRTWELARPHKMLLAVSFTCIAAGAASSLILPSYVACLFGCLFVVFESWLTRPLCACCVLLCAAVCCCVLLCAAVCCTAVRWFRLCRYQGQIMDGIIYFQIKLFLGFSVGLSFFGALQGVCMSLVGARYVRAPSLLLFCLVVVVAVVTESCL
jgi:hypothetical protein